MPTAIICKQCGKTFSCKPSHAHSRKYCSRSCYKASGWNSKAIAGNCYAKIDSELRFWSRVRKTDGCWIWTGTPSRTSHCQFCAPNGKVYVHRYAYELTYGPIPLGMFVLHRCDNPRCVNPLHLFLGTQRDNVQDCISKGRKPIIHAGAKGLKNASAKLSEADVLNIRAESGTVISLAAKYGVTPATISKIRLRRTWRHI